jgi:ribonuclease BN (tRNA processing enzyme)
VRITVLGKSPAWQDAGGACSGYLVESGETSLLLDCGCGVLGKLRRVRDYAAVDAVVLSHLHADHILDLVPFASALIFSPRGAAGELPRPALYVPPGGRAQLSALSAASGMEPEHIESAFMLSEYDPDGSVSVGELRVRFQFMPHYIASYALDVRDGSARLTFGADSGPNEALCEFAAGTDLLLIEGTLTEPDSGDPRGHMTAREAGEHGRRAGARRVVVTHVSDELDPAFARSEAAAGFGAEVDLAFDGAVYTV